MFVTLTLKFFQFLHLSANLKHFFLLSNCLLHVTWHIWPQGAILGEVLIGYRCQAFNNHELFIDKSKKVERI